jgi:hypothetical protein
MEDTIESQKNPYESFYHGLVSSKIWLCQELERIMYLQKMHNPSLHILGCWDNLLSFMLLTRKPKFYGVVHGYDIDPIAINSANKITNTWIHDYPKVYNHVLDVNATDFSSAGEESIFINCSVDHMDSTRWFESIPKGRLVCIQATDIKDENEPWLVKQTTNDLTELCERFQLSDILFTDTREVYYSTFSYNRFMLIGIK